MAGAGWSFVVSRTIAFIYAVKVMYDMKLVTARIETLETHMESWASILRIGIPSTMTNLIGPVSMSIVVSMLATYGNAVVAGFGCLLYTSPSPRDATLSRLPSSA